MRLAILSDIHGNTIALEAVLADIEARGGADCYWLLGDHVAIGPDPLGVLERITKLPHASFIYGNTDHYVTEGKRPYPLPEDVQADFSLLRRFKQVTDGFSWTQGAVTAAGWLPWLAGLPFDVRLTLPDGTRLRGVHASPMDDVTGYSAGDSADWLVQVAAAAEADVLVAGHVHYPMDKVVNGVRLVNIGSVSNPRVPDLAATYVWLTADASGYELERIHVPYDRQAVVDQMWAVRHPAAKHVQDLMNGRFIYPQGLE